MRSRPMIVEFFGPPASGKTTRALAMAEGLRARGGRARLLLSSRPEDEIPAAAPALFAPARRLLRPAVELIAAVARPQARETLEPVNRMLAQRLARGKMLRRLRSAQYLTRLAQAWSLARADGAVWFFDQAWLQVIATIAAFQPLPGDDDLLALLDMAPGADQAVFVDTPADEIETRLAARRRRLGRIGWLFEQQLGAAHEQAQAARRLRGLLQLRGRPVLTIEAGDGDALAVGLIAARAAQAAASVAPELPAEVIDGARPRHG